MIAQEPQSGPNEKPPKSPLISPWVKGPLFMYLTIVIAFAILAVFVIHHVLSLGASAR
jgi:hypothetical protein